MIQYSKAIGGNSDTRTAQVFVFPKTIPDDTHGQVILACVISGRGEDVFTKIRQTSPFIEQYFFSSESALSSRILELLNELKKHLSDVQTPQILLAALKDDVLYIVSSGDHKVRLLREGKILSLTENQPREQLISGYLKPDDCLLLISVNYIDDETKKPLYSQENIEQLLRTQPEVLEEDIITILHDAHRPYPLAAILIKNTSEEMVVSAQEEDIQSIRDQAETSEIPQVRIDRPKLNRPKIHLANIFPIFKKAGSKLIPRSKRAIALSILVPILLIGTSLGYWNLTGESRREAQAEANILSDAKNKFSEAKSLKETDPQKAQLALVESRNLLNSVLAKNNNNSQAEEFKTELDLGSDEILKIYHLSDWPVFLSLDLLKEGFKTNRMSYSLQKVLLLDESQKTLISLDLQRKTNQILAGSTQLGDARYASLNGSNAFVYSSDKGLLKVDTENQKVTSVANPDPEWGNISDIVGFASNLYVLDSGKNQIWKYLPTTTSYSDKNAYVKDGEGISLANATRMQIDFSVWVLKPGPEIIKLTGGNSDYFGVAGIDENLKEISNFFVSEDQDDIYFMEPSGSRLVVLKKNGEYKYQYKGDKFASASDFVVDEEAKKIYLLENNVIYQIDLK
jgi:hypothetical protein